MNALSLVRRVLSIGVIWGTLWTATALIVGTIIAVVDPGDIGPGEEPIVLAPRIWLAGFLCGAAFVGLVESIARGKWLDGLSRIQNALCGAVIAAALPLVMGKGLPEMLVTIPLGVLSAIVSVWISRRPGRERMQDRPSSA